MVEGIMVEGIVVSPWVDEQGPREIGRLASGLVALTRSDCSGAGG